MKRTEAATRRIGYLFSRYPVLSHTFCDNEILGLQARGWEIVVGSVSPPKNDFRHDRLNEARTRVVYAPGGSVRKVFEARARRDGTWPERAIRKQRERFGMGRELDDRARNALVLGPVLRALGVCHVHVHFANLATHTALFLDECFGISYSFTPQASDFLVDIHSPDLLRLLCERAAFVVAPCEFVREKLCDMLPGLDARVLRVYNGIDPSPYRIAAPSPRGGRLRVASVGRLVEFKGFHHLLDAVAAARGRGVDVQVDLMGDGPWRGRLESQCAELRLGDRVVFHGSVGIDAMRECFGRSDAFALACTVDADGASDMLPTVVTEAMFSGLPVVAGDVGGVSEQVVDGETGFVVAPGDVEGLADALCKLANKPALAASMGEAGRRRAASVFSVDSTLPQLEEAFAEVAQIAPMPAPRAVSVYDLSCPLSRFHCKVESSGRGDESMRWIESGDALESEIENAVDDISDALWIPDAMALEMEWQCLPVQRDRLEEWRTSLGNSVDGEFYFASALRALWLARWSRLHGGVRLWHAPGGRTALAVWIASRLTDIPYILSGMPGGALSRKLQRRIVDEAVESAPGLFARNGELPRRLELLQGWWFRCPGRGVRGLGGLQRDFRRWWQRVVVARQPQTRSTLSLPQNES